MIKQQGKSLRGVMVYLAGHCVQINDEVYLIPGGAKLQRREMSIPKECVTLSEIVESVTQAAAEAHEQT